MQKIIYYLVNKFLMNPVEKDILKYLDYKNKIIFDVGCFRGTFTKKLLKCGGKQGISFDFFLCDPNPNVKNYNFELKKKYQIKSASFLSGIKATDNIFVNKSFYV